MREFKIGDQVWWYYPPAANQKLKYPWTGPFKVLDVTKDRNTVRIAGPYLIVEASHKNKRWQAIVNPR